MTPQQIEALKKYRISIPEKMECEIIPATVLFNFLEKNTGLTEEYIYNNENPNTLSLPVYTASFEPIGMLPIGFKKDGRQLKVCNGEVIIIFRQGYAGQMYIPKEKMFYASEHTIPIQVKEEYSDRLNQHWFAQYYQPEVMHFVTGKADSGNFSELAFSKMEFYIPPREWQDRCAELYLALLNEIDNIKNSIETLSINNVEENGLTDNELIDKYEAGAINFGEMAKKAVGKRPKK